MILPPPTTRSAARRSQFRRRRDQTKDKKFNEVCQEGWWFYPADEVAALLSDCGPGGTRGPRDRHAHHSSHPGTRGPRHDPDGTPTPPSSTAGRGLRSTPSKDAVRRPCAGALTHLRRGRYARLYDLQCRRSRWLCLLSGVPVRVGNAPSPAYTRTPPAAGREKPHPFDTLNACCGPPASPRRNPDRGYRRVRRNKKAGAP